MWHNVRQLQLAASALTAAALLALLGGLGYWVMQRPMFNLHQILVEGDVEHVNAPTVRGSVVNRLHGNFFTVDLDQARQAFESMPWIQHAGVRRVWPNGLAVTLEEFRPIATWGDEDQMVSVDGDLFTANQAEVDEDMPAFYGPAGSEKIVLARYRDFAKWFAPLGLTPEEVTLSPRYAWTVRLSNGTQVELGREHKASTLQERVQRLVKAWPQATQRWGKDIEYADMRYTNGFALRSANLRFISDPKAAKQK